MAVTWRPGLTADEAAERLARSGPNVLPVASRPSALRDLIGQLVHFFALMLWVASVLAFIAGLPQLGIAIIVVIIVNGVFAFVQERRAERAAELLRDLLPAAVTVRREGQPTSSKRARSCPATSCSSPPVIGSRPTG